MITAEIPGHGIATGRSIHTIARRVFGRHAEADLVIRSVEGYYSITDGRTGQQLAEAHTHEDCPNCGELLPILELGEHMRAELRQEWAAR